MLAARVESWVMIIDLGNVNVVGFPVTAMKTITNTAMSRFTGHLGKIFVINASWTVKTMFNIVISLCDNFVKAKIKILGKGSADLLDIIDKNCLEDKYGGTSPNKIDSYFPPDMSMPGHKLLPSEFEQEEALRIKKEEAKKARKKQKRLEKKAAE